MSKKIYFDHSATTPVDKKVLEKMNPYFSDIFGNASSIHTFGQEAANGILEAREKVAGFLNCEVSEVIFTSGATESNNLAIKGFINAIEKMGKKRKDMHVITSIVEHDAVLEPFMELEKSGVKVTHVGVDGAGVVKIDKLKEAINDNTVLVSVMHVNSEVGSVQPIREIGKVIKKINESRLKEWKKMRTKSRGEKPEPIYFHTDATQAINFLNCDTKWNYVDMLSMSGHKIYGPKGVGALYKKQGVPLVSIQRGGHQESNYRSGTYNVAGIVGLGEAVNLLGQRQEKGNITITQEKENNKIVKLRKKLINGISKNISDVILNTDIDNATPSHAHFSFLGVEGEALLIALDLEGIAVSTGSACASGSLKASHVLIAMGIRKEIAHNSIRFTLGKNNTEKDIEYLMKVLPDIVSRIRKMNPLYKK